MVIFLAFLITFIATLVEVTVLPLPLTLLACIFFAIFWRKPWVFFVAIFGGLLLDSLTFQPLGTSSLFFLVIIGFIFLYGRKFETQHLFFLLCAATLGSFVYLLLFSQFSFAIIWKILLIDVLAGLVFGAVMLLESRFKSASN